MLGAGYELLVSDFRFGCWMSVIVHGSGIMAVLLVNLSTFKPFNHPSVIRRLSAKCF